MRLNVSAYAIRNPIGPLVLFLVLIVLGLVSFRGLAVTRMPNVDVPIVSLAITQSGAAPSELQTQVTKWVEDSIAGVRGVKHITPEDVAEEIVATLEYPRFDVFVPRIGGTAAKVSAVLPRRGRELLARATGADVTLLEADTSKRGAYELRAAQSPPRQVRAATAPDAPEAD